MARIAAAIRFQGMRIGAITLFAFLTVGCGSALGDGSALPARSPASAIASAPAPAGDTIERTPLDFDKGGSHYIGGITRVLLPVAPVDVLAAFDDVPALKRMLPRTKSARLVSSENGVRKVELVQGNSIVTAQYTIDLVPSATPGELGFRLDRSRPHDIDDVYGYFRVEAAPGGKSLVTTAAAVSMGSSFLEMFFGKKVQDVILSAPVAMRDYFASKEVDSSGVIARNDAP